MKTTIYYILLFFCCLETSNANEKDYFWKDIDPAFDTLMKQMESYVRYPKSNINPQAILRQMHLFSQSNDNAQIQARVMYWEACENKNLSIDSISILLEQAISLTDQSKYPYDRARMDMKKAIISSQAAQYAEAYLLYSNLINSFHKIKDYRLEACALNNIGCIFLLLNEYNDAITSFTKADSIFTRLDLQKERLECRLLLTNIYIVTDRKKEAYALLKPIVENYKPTDYPSDMRIAILSNYLSCLDDKNEARKYSDEAYNLALKNKNAYYLPVAILNKSWVLLHLQQTDSAYLYAQKAASLIMQSPALHGMKEGVYKLLTSIYENKKQWDSAYHYKSLYHTYQDSIRGKDVLSNIHQIEIKKQIEEYKIQSTLEKQRNHQKIVFYMTIGSALLIMLLLSIYIIYLLRKKMQREQQKQRIKDQEYIARLNKEKDLVETKNRELSSNAILLMKKNETLRDMLDNIKNTQEKDQVLVRKLQQKIQLELQTKGEWDSFKLYFDQIHPSFFATLKEKFPVLTDNDLRLSAYIRIGLNNKQIAEILQVQSKAVLQARYRLKKKMELADEINIGDYLKDFPISN